MITLLVRPEHFEREEISVEGTAYRHLFRARRLAVGARLRVVDGRGRARWAEAHRVERRAAFLALGDPAPAREPSYRLRLWVAALRSERASWLVEKATELGAHSIRFISTERAPREYGPASLDRLRRVAAAAVEQSHRSLVPEVTGVDPWHTAVSRLEDERTMAGDRFFLDPGSETEALVSRQSSGIVLVGPEGGWSRREAIELERVGCRRASLGPRTLRVETAAVAASVRLLLEPD